MHLFMTELDLNQLRGCAEDCAVLASRKAGRAVSRMYGELFAAIGLEPTQYSLLVAGGAAAGVTISQLAEFLAMDRSALARNLALLEDRGLVLIRKGDDRRARHLHLTETGGELLAEALPLWSEAQARAKASFGAERLERLVAELHAFSAALSTA
jgi:DNA-binding MarR family transcriptional regulator